MQISLNIESLLTGVVIAQGVFAALVLWNARQNQRSNKIASVLLICISLWLVDAFFNSAGIYQQDPDYYFKPIYFSFAFGPLIYFYVKSMTNADFRFRKKDAVHFIPVFLQFGLYLFLTFQDYSYKRWYWREVHQPYTYRIEFIGTFISLAIYLLTSLRLLSRYQKWVNNHFSEVSKLKLNWLRVVLAIMLVLCVQWFVEVILREGFNNYIFNYSILILGIATLVLAFGGIRQSNLSEVSFVEEIPEAKAMVDFIDDELIKMIIDQMEKEKDYLNPTLTLKDFAKAMDQSPRLISQHINHGLNQSFIDFVNTYRVNEVKRRIESDDKKKYTLLAIGFDSGFNSKSTFQRIFKKHTGVAPGDYQSGVIRD